MYKQQYHASNYSREFNNDAFYNKIIIYVEKDIKRELSEMEKQETVSFIQKLDPSVFEPKMYDKTVGLMVSTLSKEFKSYDCQKPFYDDSQQMLRTRIGTSSESGTSHGIYDNPGFFR